MYTYNTLQQLFDAVVNHSRTMTEKIEMINGNSCCYRSENGNRCFIGGLITDNKYSDELEYKNAFNPIVLRAADINPELANSALDLQIIHDRHFNSREQQLIRFANSNQLIMPS